MLPGKRTAIVMVLASPVWGMGDPVTLNINGNVKTAPCQVSSDSVNKTVDLTPGQSVTASSLYTAGSTTPWVAFELSVEQCPAGTSRVTVLFNGNADSDHPNDMYRNIGTASPVAIQVQASDGVPLGNGKSLTANISNQRYTWRLRARIYSEQGLVTPGTINSAITISMTYQ
ncbi:fimbrial protein [Citrobacter werkmanii]|uniref:fimbrial protein n=1 Tax=Citrobacter werkmanii TaxID=67827 RepID=UPI000B40CBF4|nr:fimbrial protein [Citrobacter werkmanii]RNW25604.1 type 1 fimbrial protein [Citrobacter werkmanii]